MAMRPEEGAAWGAGACAQRALASSTGMARSIGHLCLHSANMGPEVLMLDVIKDLYAHQEWADASHWRAVLGSEAARKDPELKERLVHLHGAQQVWLGRWQGVSFPFPKADDHATIEDTYHFAQACHAALR